MMYMQTTMKREFFSVILIFLILCIPFHCALPGEDEEPEKEGIDSDVKNLGKELEQIRKLSFRERIAVSVKQRNEIKTIIEQMIDTEYSAARLNALKKSLVELGFIPQAVNVRQVLVDFYSSETAVVYDANSSTLYLDSDIMPEHYNGRPSMEEANRILMENLGFGLYDYVIFHELEHALVNQNFPIKAYQNKIAGNSDKALALMSVLEGDAFLANLIFLYKPMGLEEDAVKRDLPAPEILKSNVILSLQEGKHEYPDYFASIFLFPVIQGLDFVRAIYRERGWEGVNQALSSPPTSTEQILHPKKYLIEKDIPRDALIRKFIPADGGNWKEVSSDTLGEFGSYLLINLNLMKEDTALIASEGWGGDRYLLLENDKGETILFLSTLWDSSKDALEFWEAYTRSLQSGSFRVLETVEKEGRSIRYLVKDDTIIRITLEGDSVEIIKAPSKILNKMTKETDKPVK